MTDKLSSTIHVFTYLASWPVSLAEAHGKHGGRATFEENGDNNYFAASVDVDVDVGDLDDDNELTTITMLMNTCNITRLFILIVPPNFQYQNEKRWAANQRFCSMKFPMYKRSSVVEQFFLALKFGRNS